MNDVTLRIEEAIEAGEILRVKYAGGSQPGAIRQLAPIQLLENGKLRARCLASGKAKMFNLEKIEVVESGDHGAAVYKPLARPGFTNMTEALSDCREKLQEAGWLIHESLQLYMYNEDEFQNELDIELIHNTMIAGFAFGISEGGRVSIDNVEAHRPWRLQCKSANYSASFSSLDSAIEKLLVLAKKPKTGGR